MLPAFVGFFAHVSLLLTFLDLMPVFVWKCCVCFIQSVCSQNQKIDYLNVFLWAAREVGVKNAQK